MGEISCRGFIENFWFIIFHEMNVGFSYISAISKSTGKVLFQRDRFFKEKNKNILSRAGKNEKRLHVNI